MSLWAEHLGTLEDIFEEPHDLKCLKRVNNIAKDNWNIYVSEENKNMRGLLLPYPVMVSRSGKVSSLPGYESFPDVGAKVLGGPTTLPDVLTT